jgi:cytochrome c
MKRTLILVLVAAVAVLAGCGGGSGDDTGTASKSTESTKTAAQDDTGAHSTKGIGPIKEIDVASLDRGLAVKGGEVFQAKCTPCHKMAEKYIGPALKGVTTRHEPEWIMNMILNPDVMVKEDPAAKKLLAEFIAPMTNQNLTEEEATAVLVYFLQYDAEAPE